MAVKSKNSLPRTSVIALAIAALTLPVIAQAAPEERGSWRQRVAREDAPRADRPERRQERPARQASTQVEQAPRQQQTTRSWAPRPQAQPAQVRQEAEPTRSSWRDRVGRTDTGERRIRTADWQSRVAQPERVAPRPVTTQSADWRSRAQRTDRDRTRDRDRDYWRNRDWNRHWDRSRHSHWSGWNDRWNWTWGHDYRRWNANWRSSSRYDWYGWRNRYPSYFQVGLYYSPYRNYSYRRLRIGYLMDALFFDEDYWIADPSYYRLPEAYGPYRWVRYYDDAILVDIYSGEVADVIYSFFW